MARPRKEMLATLIQNVDDLRITPPCCWLAVITPAIEHYGVPMIVHSGSNVDHNISPLPTNGAHVVSLTL